MNAKSTKRPKLAILTHLIAPYRIPIYKGLARDFQTTILISKGEDNRAWQGFQVPDADVARLRGLTVKRRIKGTGGSIAEEKYVQFQPGYLLWLLRHNPDCVISTEMGWRSICAILFGLLRRKPVWLWWGGTPHTEAARNRAKLFLRRTLFARAPVRWISYGETSTVYLTSLGIPTQRVVQIQNSVDESLFTPDGKTFDFSLPHPIALFAGRLIQRKGLEELLQSVSRLQRSGLDCSLAVVGNGPEAVKMLALANDLKLQNWVHIPEIPAEDMPPVYRGADFLVLPTFDDVWGLVVNESMLCGTPAVVSQFAGCAPEIVPPSAVFDPSCPESIDAALKSGFLGELPPPDLSSLLTTDEIVSLIETDILERI